MAYDRRGLRVVHELSVPYPGDTSPYRVPRHICYATPDTLVAVTTAGYFNNALLGASGPDLIPGDTLHIWHTTGGAMGTAFRTVTSVAGGAVTIAALG